MKPLVRLATRLYPSAWRKRYGSEFQALLEDVNPGWSELFNVFGGAIKMQLTTGATYLKLGAGFAIAGLLTATVASFMVQKTYVSTAVFRVTNVDDLAKAKTKVLSRTSLSQVIQEPTLQLYPSERRQQPLEDVIEAMRTRAIHIAVLPDHHSVQVSFSYMDKEKARTVVRLLIAKLSQAFEGAKAGVNLEIVDPPSLPQSAASPNRPAMAITGLACGLVFGLIAAVFVKHPRRSRVFAVLGFIGCVVGGAISFLVPNRYISHAVIRVDPYDHNFEQALNRLKRPGFSISIMNLTDKRSGAAAVELTFEDTDRDRAKSTVQASITTLISGNIATAVESHGAVTVPTVETLDNANLPLDPAYPNRIVISLLGLCCGLFIAALTLMLQRRGTVRAA